LNWSDEAEQFCLRVALVRAIPEGKEFPVFDEAWLVDHLPAIARGSRSYADLREKLIKRKALAPHRAHRSIGSLPADLRTNGKHDPSAISGNGAADAVPADRFSVKLQELRPECDRNFERQTTCVDPPSSPAGRLLQITQDLKLLVQRIRPCAVKCGNTRHPWPEDFTAPPQRVVCRT
jgi:hypothetical protein